MPQLPTEAKVSLDTCPLVTLMRCPSCQRRYAVVASILAGYGPVNLIEASGVLGMSAYLGHPLDFRMQSIESAVHCLVCPQDNILYIVRQAAAMTSDGRWIRADREKAHE